MKFEWEEIYNIGHSASPFFEATYRAKVIGGWVIRHETGCNYQYGCSDNCEDHPSHVHVNEEGYQDIKNTITFISDPEHKWTIEPGI